MSDFNWREKELIFKPIYTKLKFQKINKEFSGITPPSIFIGSKLDYPNLNVGILSPITLEEKPSHYDNPEYWYSQKLSINQIIDYRTNLMNSRFKTNAKGVRTNSKLIQLSQEVAMSMKHTNIDFSLKKRPFIQQSFDKITSQFGPTAEIENAKATENISIPTSVEKIYNDTDLKAADAIETLTKKSFNEYQITQLLSAGTLGLKYNRRFVPTRFSITATDDILCKLILNEVKSNQQINENRIYFGNYLGNYFMIILLKGLWSYELFEMYMPDFISKEEKIDYTTDYEFYFGRKNYAENCVGGYYAARLPITELLKKEKIQASVIVLRFITSEYKIPLGVFVVRQAVKSSLQSTPILYENRKETLKRAQEIILKIFKYNISNIIKESKVLNNIKKQTTLAEFI